MGDEIRVADGIAVAIVVQEFFNGGVGGSDGMAMI